MNKLKLCLVGVGSIGRRHLRLLNERDDVTLSVVEPFEPSWQRIVEEVGTFERFASLGNDNNGAGSFHSNKWKSK